MIIDILFIILMISAAIKGFRKGLIMSVFSFAAFFIGLAAATKCSSIVANHLQESTQQPSRWWPAIAFLIVMVIVGIIIRMVGSLLERTMEFAMLGWVNRLGGFLVLAVMHVLILSVALFYLEKLHIIPESTRKASLVYDQIMPWGPWAIDGLGRIMPVFKNMFTDLQGYFNDLGSKIGT
jgi:membrane protein required for colicin V production